MGVPLRGKAGGLACCLPATERTERTMGNPFQPPNFVFFLEASRGYLQFRWLQFIVQTKIPF